MNDYSRLINEGSLSEKSCKVSETGTLYVEIINANAGVLSDELTFSGESGELKFKRTGEETVSSEQEIFLISPQTKKSAVVYYRLKGENGISRSYKAVIYEEAA